MTVVSPTVTTKAAGSFDFPPRVAAAGLAAIALAAPAIALIFSPGLTGWLEYDRARIAEGEIWRMIGCHWTHWSLDHLIWDVAAFAMLVAASWGADVRRVLATLASAAVTIPLGVWLLLPEMQHYRGLSGLDSALFTLVALQLLKRERAAGRAMGAWLVALMLLGFCLKLAFEIATGTTVFVNTTEFVAVPLAHLVGGACGAVGAFGLNEPQSSRRSPPRYSLPRSIRLTNASSSPARTTERSRSTACSSEASASVP